MVYSIKYQHERNGNENRTSKEQEFWLEQLQTIKQETEAVQNEYFNN